MRITNITAKNLKGSTFSEPLKAITLFHGLNFAGKSTRIDALALALTHTLPGVAARSSDIFAHAATGSSLEVGVQASPDHGKDFSVASWFQGRKGIETKFAGTLTAPLLLFNTSEFLGLSPKERTKFLFSVLPPPSLEKVGSDAIIAKLKAIKCESHTERHECAIGCFETLVHDSWLASQDDPSESIQDWLERLVEEVATTTKEAKASAKTMRETARGTTSLRTDAPALGPVEEAKRKAQEAHTAAVREEQAVLNELVTAERAVKECKNSIEKWKGSLTEDYVTPLKVEQAELETYLLREDVIKEKLVSSSHEQEVLGVNKARQTDASSAWSIARQAVKDFDQLECCPTCKAKAKGWKQVVLEGLIDREKACAQEVEFYNNEVAKAKTALQLAEEKVNAEGLRLVTIRNSRKRLAEVGVTLQHYADQSAQREPSEKASLKLPELDSDSKTAGQKYSLAKQKCSQSYSALVTAETAHRVALGDAAAAKQIQQATEKAELLDAKAQVGQELRDLLHALLQECVKQSIQPLLELCNGLCANILPHPLAFMDGEIVMLNTGLANLTYSHRTFSGTEKALAYAALSVGLAASSPVKLVILDELGRLDRNNQLLVYEQLRTLIKDGKIDQAILVSTEPLPVVMGEWSSINFLQTEVKR